MTETDLEVHEIIDLSRLEREWNVLCVRCPWATAFHTPEWAQAFASAFDAPLPRAVCARAGGVLVGLAPLYVREERGARVLSPLGIGVSDRLDPLLAPEYEAAAARAIWRGILAARASWDRCEYAALTPGTPFVNASPPGTRTWDDEPCLEAELPEGGWSASAASWLRRNLGKAGRRAARAGLEIVEATPAAARDFFAELARLHAERWSERGSAGIFADPRVRRMHEAALPALVGRRLVRLYALRRDERVVAALYTMEGARRVACYACGFDAAEKKLSPVALLVAHAADAARARGATVLDFLRGREAYKYDWGARDVPRFGLTLAAAT